MVLSYCQFQFNDSTGRCFSVAFRSAGCALVGITRNLVVRPALVLPSIITCGAVRDAWLRLQRRGK